MQVVNPDPPPGWIIPRGKKSSWTPMESRMTLTFSLLGAAMENIQKSYGKWPFIVSFPIKNVIFHSYVSLPAWKMMELMGRMTSHIWQKIKVMVQTTNHCSNKTTWLGPGSLMKTPSGCYPWRSKIILENQFKSTPNEGCSGCKWVYIP